MVPKESGVATVANVQIHLELFYLLRIKSLKEILAIKGNIALKAPFIFITG